MTACPLWIPRYGGQPAIPWDMWQDTDARPSPVGSTDGNRTSALEMFLVPGAQPTPPIPSPPQEADDMFSDNDRSLLTSLGAAVGRLEARAPRQVARASGAVYSVTATERVWIPSEAVRLHLAQAFGWGAPEKWADADIDAIPLVGPEAPGVKPAA